MAEPSNPVLPTYSRSPSTKAHDSPNSPRGRALDSPKSPRPTPLDSVAAAPKQVLRDQSRSPRSKAANELLLAEEVVAAAGQQSAQVLAPEPQVPPDYIMLGEFSEQLGPTCIWRIPTPDVEPDKAAEAKLLASAMAVDYQSRQGALSNFAEDTKVSNCDPVSGATQYLHHFTLLDVHARGYVRPMMLAYITWDPMLIMSHFEEMAMLFAEVAKILKRANRLIMRHDIDHRLADLQFTLDVFASGEMDKHFAEPPKYTESAIPEHVEDLKRFRRKLESFPEPECLAGDMDAEEARRLLEEPPYTQKVVPYIHKGHFDKPLRGMEGLCGEATVEEVRGLLFRVLHHFERVEPIRALEMMAPADDPPAMSLTLGETLLINFNSAVERGAVLQPVIDSYCIGMNSQQLLTQPARASLHTSIKSSVAGHTPPGALQHLPVGYAGMPRPHTGNTGDVAPHVLFEQLSAAPTPVAAAKPFESLLLINPEESAPSPAERARPSDDSDMSSLKMRTYQFFSKQTSGTVQSFASSIWESPEERPGFKLRDLIAKFTFVKHIIFSLLKGRPVIVRGSPMSQLLVVDTVTALSLFVSSASAHAVQRAVEHWRETPIRMADMARLRLVGYSSKLPLPKAVEKCASVFNIDDGVLTAPAYPPCGQFVEEIIAARIPWPDEETFLAHIQEVLIAIAVRAFLFYHLCCVGACTFNPLSPDMVAQMAQLQATPGDERSRSKSFHRSTASSPMLLSPMLTASASLNGLKESQSVLSPGTPLRRSHHKDSPSLPATAASQMPLDPAAAAEFEQWTQYALTPVKPATRENAKNRFWKDMAVAPGDREILEHVAAVIKDQQMAELRTGAQVQPVILDYSQTQLFRNTASAVK